MDCYTATKNKQRKISAGGQKKRPVLALLTASFVLGGAAAALGDPAPYFSVNALDAARPRVDPADTTNANSDGALAAHSIAIGENAVVSPDARHGIAIGENALAGYQHALALGESAQATAWRSLAIGNGAAAHGENSLALGLNATVLASADHSIALGENASAQEWRTIAIGEKATAAAQHSAAIGENANAAGSHSLAIGENARSRGAHSLVIGENAQAEAQRSIAIGADALSRAQYALSLGTNAAARSYGSIAVGNGARANTETGGAVKGWGIAIGANAETRTDSGRKPGTIAFGRTAAEYLDGIAIGANTYARNENVTIGNHDYTKTLGGYEFSTAVTVPERNFKGVASTTVGTNSFNMGSLAALTGAYSAIISYSEGDGMFAAQNYGATVLGSLNTIRSQEAPEWSDTILGRTVPITASYGIANSIVGVANSQISSNGAIIMGAGNTISNSYRPVSVLSMYSLLTGSSSTADDLANSVTSAVSSSGGSVLIIGGANTADQAVLSQVTGVGNRLEGTQTKRQTSSLLGTSTTYSYDTQNDYIAGYYNTVRHAAYSTVIGSNSSITGTSADVAQNNIVIGDSRRLGAVSSSIVMGPASTAAARTVNVSDTVIIGRDARSAQAGGVALGAESAALSGTATGAFADRRQPGQAESVWTSTRAAVAVGNPDANITRQITGVAAGAADTDAANVAQLRSVSDAAEAGWNVAANNEAPQKIAPRDTLTFKDGDNIKITQNGAELTVSATATGKVAQGDTGLISGGALFDEVRTGDGTVILAANTAGQNLEALDKALGDANGAVSVLDERAVKYDSANKDTVTLAGQNGTAISNLAKGEISANSTQAVNGSQLFAAGQSAAQALGGGSTFDASTGSLSASFTIDNATYTTVNDAFNALASSAAVTWELGVDDAEPVAVDKSSRTVRFISGRNVELTQDGTAVTVATSARPTFETVSVSGAAEFAGSVSVAQNLSVAGRTALNELEVNGESTFSGKATFKKDVSVGGKLSVAGSAAFDKDVSVGGALTVDGPALFKQGASMGGYRIADVAPGRVAAGSTDAVNGSQLFEMGRSLNDSMNRMNSRIQNDIRHVGSRSAALAALHPMDFDGRRRTSVAFGYGNYRGDGAVAVGVSHYFSRDALFTLGSTIGDQPMVNAGLSFRLGRDEKREGKIAAVREQRLARLESDTAAWSESRRELDVRLASLAKANEDMIEANRRKDEELKTLQKRLDALEKRNRRKI